MVPFMRLRAPHEVKLNAISGSEGDEGGTVSGTSPPNFQRFVAELSSRSLPSNVTLERGH